MPRLFPFFIPGNKLRGVFQWDVFHQLFSQDKHINTLLEQIKKGEADQQLITGLTGSARPAFLNALFLETNKPIYVLSPNLLQAQKLVDDLASLIGEESVFIIILLMSLLQQI